jgi:hypothetical protein
MPCLCNWRRGEYISVLPSVRIEGAGFENEPRDGQDRVNEPYLFLFLFLFLYLYLLSTQTSFSSRERTRNLRLWQGLVHLPVSLSYGTLRLAYLFFR